MPDFDKCTIEIKLNQDDIKAPQCAPVRLLTMIKRTRGESQTAVFLSTLHLMVNITALESQISLTLGQFQPGSAHRTATDPFSIHSYHCSLDLDTPLHTHTHTHTSSGSLSVLHQYKSFRFLSPQNRESSSQEYYCMRLHLKRNPFFDLSALRRWISMLNGCGLFYILRDKLWFLWMLCDLRRWLWAC